MTRTTRTQDAPRGRASAVWAQQSAPSGQHRGKESHLRHRLQDLLLRITQAHARVVQPERVREEVGAAHDRSGGVQVRSKGWRTRQRRRAEDERYVPTRAQPFPEVLDAPGIQRRPAYHTRQHTVKHAQEPGLHMPARDWRQRQGERETASSKERASRGSLPHRAPPRGPTEPGRAGPLCRSTPRAPCRPQPAPPLRTQSKSTGRTRGQGARPEGAYRGE